MNGVWSVLRGRLGVAALGIFVVVGALEGVAGGLPMAGAAPATDGSGFVDSTARCAPPSRAVAFGYTASSRVAICTDDASGQYQYRGVRVADGARLILAATSTARGYVAENDGITYTVTATALTITSNGQQIRTEPMLDFHGSAGDERDAEYVGSVDRDAERVDAAERGAPGGDAVDPLPPPLPAEVGGGGGGR